MSNLAAMIQGEVRRRGQFLSAVLTIVVSWCATGWTAEPPPQPKIEILNVKVTQADGNQTWSAPVWLTVGRK